eukprot:superscaffoldBa00007390_g22479
MTAHTASYLNMASPSARRALTFNGYTPRGRSLCEGAKWSSRRQKVGSSHASEVVSPAGEGGTPGWIVHLHMDELGFISQWRAIFAGGLAGVAAALVTYPLEVAETRLIVQNCREPTYVGVVHTLSKISRNEGLLALYRGFSLTVLGAFPFSVGCYAVYMNLDKLWQEPPSRFSSLQNFINGCLAAGVAQTLSYPFETVKRKMQ